MKNTTPSLTTTAQNLSATVESIRSATKAKKQGDGWQGRCPAHDDKTPSLSIRQADGRVLLFCHTGCSLKNIVSALGLEMSDLFAEKRPEPRYEFQCAYDYRDESGALLYQAVRKRLVNPDQCPDAKPKDFRQRRPDGQDGWIDSLGDVRRVLYRLPEMMAHPDATVFICEGEKDADRLIELGLVATTNPMGAGKWRESYSILLRDREVVILPDNDKPGREHARDVARSLSGKASSIRIIKLPNLPDGGDLSDWLNAGGSEESLCQMVEGAAEWTPADSVDDEEERETANDNENGWTPPAPLSHYNQPDFPVETLPSWLGAFVEGLALATQTPTDLAAMISIAVCSASVARNVRVKAREGWEEPLNIFTTIVLPPASRKSQVLNEATRPLFDYQRELIINARDFIAEQRSEYNILEQEKTELERKCARAEPEDRAGLRELAKAKARELAARKLPVLPKMLVDDVTAEVLATILSEQGGRIAMFSAEGGIFDTLAGRYSNGTPSIDVLLKGHCAEDLMVERRDRSEHIEKPAVTIGLAVQPDVLRGMIEKPGFRGRGLIGRFLYAIPQNTIGKRKSRPAPMAEKVRLAYHKHVSYLADIAPFTNSDGRTESKLIQLSVAADDLLANFEEELEPMLGGDGELASLQDWAGKLAGAIVRLAGILHLAENAQKLREGWIGEISAATLENAIRIGRYLLAHAQMAYAEMAADVKVEDARFVLRWIEKNKSNFKDNSFTKREAYQGTKSRFGQVALLEPALKVLEDHGFIEPEELSTERKRGRQPSLRFLVNPLAKPTLPPPPPH